MKKKKTSYSRKKWLGLMFVLPWVIGVITFYLRPLISSFIYSLSDVYLTVSGLSIDFLGLNNYRYLFYEDPNFTRTLLTTVGEMLYRLPLVLVLSLFIAILLNKSFKGRLFFRGVFFLPVIIASGYVISIINGSASAEMLSTAISSESGGGANAMMTVDAIKNVLLQIGIPENVQETLLDYVSSIFNLIWYSGIQILLFLASLQSVSGSLREVAHVEGITEWQYFWKITLPMISPAILLNIVYTIVDCFTDTSNVLMQKIHSATLGMQFANSAAMAWIYFAIILLIIGVVYLLIGKRVFYMNG